MCVPNGPLFQRFQVYLFQRFKVYDWPFFSTKSIWMTWFFWIVKGPTFLISWYMHIFFAQIFFEAACSLGIQWIDCDICLTTSNKWVQKSKGSIWIGQHFGWSSIWMGPFFQRLGIWMGKILKYWLAHPYHNYLRSPPPPLPTHTRTHPERLTLSTVYEVCLSEYVLSEYVR